MIKKYTKNHFKCFYRDMRIHNNRSKTKSGYGVIQNFHITYAESWDYVVKAYKNRTAKDEVDLIQERLIFKKLFIKEVTL